MAPPGPAGIYASLRDDDLAAVTRLRGYDGDDALPAAAQAHNRTDRAGAERLDPAAQRPARPHDPAARADRPPAAERGRREMSLRQPRHQRVAAEGVAGDV